MKSRNILMIVISLLTLNIGFAATQTSIEDETSTEESTRTFSSEKLIPGIPKALQGTHFSIGYGQFNHRDPDDNFPGVQFEIGKEFALSGMLSTTSTFTASLNRKTKNFDIIAAGVGFTKAEVTVKINTFFLSQSINGNIEFEGGIFQPFLVGGIGAGFISREEEIKALEIEEDTYDESSFAYFAGAGLRVQTKNGITPQIMVAYRNVNQKEDVYGMNISASIGYTF